MKKTKKPLIIAVVAIVLSVITGFLATVFFGNPLDRIKIRNIADQYLADNYSEMNPSIVDIDYFDTPVEGPYHIEVYLEKTGKTFTLHYSESGELEWDAYDYSIYEEKYGEAYFEKGIFAIKDIIGTPQNEKQKAVTAVINFDSEIKNGGLAQYLINEDNENIVNITKYLRMIGATEQAALLETFAAENGVELKHVEISGVDEHIEFEKSKPFEKFNDAYMEIYAPDDACKPDLEGQIVSYVQDNIEDF